MPGGGLWLAGAASSRATLVSPRASEIVYDRAGAFITQIAHSDAHGDYGFWPLEKVPERFAQATLALEDRRFHQHPGVDLIAILRAGWRNLFHRHAREGASTLAMQVARMQHPARRGFAQKITEAATALALTARFGRDAILAHYLRLAPYGAGSHGAAHAARFWFDKPLEDLSLAETALLAAVPQAPGAMNLANEKGLERAKRRAASALDELAREGHIDAAQALAAKAQLNAMRPLPLKRRPPEALHLALRFERLVRDGLLQAPARDPILHASVDLAVETRVAALARRYLDAFRDAGARQVAMMVVERGSNAVLAEVGSARYGARDAAAGAFDFTRVARSPGSALKPFVYALAFERGALNASDLLIDAPEVASGINNADGAFLGPMSPRQALANSRNVPAANLLRRVGVDANFEFLHDLGLHDLETPADSFGAAMAIGALPTRLDRLMRAYAMLADDGVLRDLSYAREQRRSAPRRALSLDTARLITSMLADPQARLPTFPRYGPLDYPFAVAVKTGTSQGYRDAWTLAYSKKFIVGVWLGRADAGAMREVGGAASAARLAHAVLTMLHGAKPGEIAGDDFAPPPGRTQALLSLTLGQDGAAVGTLREWLKPQEAPHALLLPGVANQAAASPPELKIATPEPDTHIWRNPEQPASLNKLALKLKPLPWPAQIVWYVDGDPFVTADADQTVFWPLRPGAHRIEARLALHKSASRSVRVVVE